MPNSLRSAKNKKGPIAYEALHMAFRMKKAGVRTRRKYGIQI